MASRADHFFRVLKILFLFLALQFPLSSSLYQFSPQDVEMILQDACIVAGVLPVNETVVSTLVSLERAFRYEEGVMVGVIHGDFRWETGEKLKWADERKLLGEPKDVAFFPRAAVERNCLILPPKVKPRAQIYTESRSPEVMVEFLNQNCNTYRTLEGNLSFQGLHREEILGNIFHVADVSSFTMGVKFGLTNTTEQCMVNSHTAPTEAETCGLYEGVQGHDDFRTVGEYQPSPESVTLHVENGGRERMESPSSGKQKVSDRIVECERIPMPTRAEFFHDYVKRSRPVIITGTMDQWNVFEKWSNEFLRERFGKEEVHIKLTSGGEYEGVEDASLWEDFGTFQIPRNVRDQLPFPDLVVVRPATMNLKFGKFLDMIEETARSEVKNMSAYLEYSSIPQYMPSLEADIPGFPFVNDLLTRRHLNMWLSDGNTLGKLHFDPFDNLLCQVILPADTLRSLLVHPKDKVDDLVKTDCVYKVPCASCEEVYIGETGRTLGTRLKEHKKEATDMDAVKYTRSQKRQAQQEEKKSAVTDHIARNNCVIDWEGAKVIERTTDAFISGKKEVILFEPHDNTRLYEAHIPEAILGFNNRTRKFRRKTLLDSTSMVMSPVDILKPNFKRFPKFAEAVPMNCTIEEGEVLYMPAHWWHLCITLYYLFLTQRFPKFAEAVPINCTIEEGEVLYMPAHWWHLCITLYYLFLTQRFPKFAEAIPVNCTIEEGEVLYMPAQCWHLCITLYYLFLTQRFPKFAEAVPINCTIEEGEVLYMPAHWWHLCITLYYLFLTQRFPKFAEAIPVNCTIEEGEVLYMPAQCWHLCITLYYLFLTQRFPKFAEAVPVNCTIEEGEVLYMPAHWWHLCITLYYLFLTQRFPKFAEAIPVNCTIEEGEVLYMPAHWWHLCITLYYLFLTQRFPKFAEAVPMNCTIEEGEVLYMPAHWWHLCITLYYLFLTQRLPKFAEAVPMNCTIEEGEVLYMPAHWWHLCITLYYLFLTQRFPKFAEAIPVNCTIEEGEVLYMPAHWWHLCITLYYLFLTQRFPKFAEAVPMNCTIEEGEVLYMPSHWWHEVQSYPSSTQHRNLAINFWYEPFLTKEFPCQTCSLDVNPHYRHLLG
ncbi:JMJD7 [Branchiostoma lanceolatum]|uniref:JMJD7 protein n=1 Tax=Branchiostoma lanceolatum TaxID=7740 RepID=A0A8J9ZMM1_BRALA|nr:JMJD7 [Branchiostoma lanceolatum]